MKLCFMRDSGLARLKTEISANLNMYKQDNPWLESYFENAHWHQESGIILPDFSLELPSSQDTMDFENTKRLYLALKNINVTQASDERLWVYLGHTHFWGYMRKRWPVERYESQSNWAENIKERYFFMSNRDRALLRNGIARLWWYGYTTYDESREDPFELTKILLSKLDIAQSLLERSFSRNQTISKAVLAFLLEREQNGHKVPSREDFRNLMKYLNHVGGVTILDSLEEPDIKLLLEGKFNSVA